MRCRTSPDMSPTPTRYWSSGCRCPLRKLRSRTPRRPLAVMPCPCGRSRRSRPKRRLAIQNSLESRAHCDVVKVAVPCRLQPPDGIVAVVAHTRGGGRSCVLRWRYREHAEIKCDSPHTSPHIAGCLTGNCLGMTPPLAPDGTITAFLTPRATSPSTSCESAPVGPRMRRAIGRRSCPPSTRG